MGHRVVIGPGGRRMIAEIDVYGEVRLQPDTSHMLAPVRHGACGAVFDEADVKTRIARHLDCDVYLCPSCGQQMDNRPFGYGAFSSSQGVVRLGRDGLPR